MAGAVLRAIAALGSSPSELRLFVYDHKTIRPHVASVLGADALHWFDGNYTPRCQITASLHGHRSRVCGRAC